MTRIFAERSAEKRREGEALIREPTTSPANHGRNACGPMAAPSIRRRHKRRLHMARDQVLALPDAARCRSMRVAPRTDDIHLRAIASFIQLAARVRGTPSSSLLGILR
jgi:hypothetical protein